MSTSDLSSGKLSSAWSEHRVLQILKMEALLRELQELGQRTREGEATEETVRKCCTLAAELNNGTAKDRRTFASFLMGLVQDGSAKGGYGPAPSGRAR